MKSFFPTIEGPMLESTGSCPYQNKPYSNKELCKNKFWYVIGYTIQLQPEDHEVQSDWQYKSAENNTGLEYTGISHVEALKLM